MLEDENRTMLRIMRNGQWSFGLSLGRCLYTPGLKPVNTRSGFTFTHYPQRSWKFYVGFFVYVLLPPCEFRQTKKHSRHLCTEFNRALIRLLTEAKYFQMCFCLSYTGRKCDFDHNLWQLDKYGWVVSMHVFAYKKFVCFLSKNVKNDCRI